MEYLKKPDFLMLRNRAFYYWSLLRLYIRIFPYAAINDWVFGNHLCELPCKIVFFCLCIYYNCGHENTLKKMRNCVKFI